MREQLYWRGVPVPYVAYWTSETERYVDSDKHSAGLPALFTRGKRGEGEPIWGKMHEARQRESCDLQRCQVCNCKLKGERAFGIDRPSVTRYEGRVYQVLTEPPVCARCAKYSMAHCPGNHRIKASGEMRCFEVYGYAAIGQILQAVDGGDEELNRLLKPGDKVIGYHKCVLVSAEQITPEELLRRVS